MQRRASTQTRCHTQSQLVQHQRPRAAVGLLLGQLDQTAVLTAAVAAGQGASQPDRLPQCFQSQALAEAAAQVPVAAAATAHCGAGGTAAAVGAADQPPDVGAIRFEIECFLLAADVSAAAAVTACGPALNLDLVASCAPALCSALGPAPAASH